MPWTVEEITAAQSGYLPSLMGIEWTSSEPGSLDGRLDVEQRHLASTGFLHAASVVALADSACGYGCLALLPKDASGFTTVELKANYLGTAPIRSGICCEARVVHAGRTTQVWDATVLHEDSRKTIALFRCTQIILYSKA